MVDLIILLLGIVIGFYLRERIVSHIETTRMIKFLEEQEKARFEVDFLNLCEKHQQRSPGTHYASHNCDYCKKLGRPPGPK